MNHAKRAAVTAAATAVIAGSAIVGGASSATADSCPTGQEQVVVAGESTCGTVTEYPDVKIQDYPDQTNRSEETPEESEGTERETPALHSVTPSVGVIIRDDNGSLTTSGMSNRDQFEYLGEKMEGTNGDGTLIKIRQTTTGMGGWGDLFEGWIPVKYTQNPSAFN